MAWYRFQYVSSGPSSQLTEEYFWFDGKCNEKGFIREEVGRWASRIHGDGDRAYSGKFKRVNRPPRAVLEEMIADTKAKINGKKQYLILLEGTLKNIDKK